MLKGIFYACAILLILTSGCGGKPEDRTGNQQKKTIDSNEATKVAEVTDNVSNIKKEVLSYIEVKTWIDDFRNFRMAIYNNDVPKLETYFDFPFDDKGNSILGLCSISDNDWAARNKQFNNPDLFYKADLAKYYKNIFDKNFTALLLKVKSDQLFSKQHLQTKIIKDNDGAYQLFVDYSEVENTLTLNFAISNNFKDENGEYVSEGEHNIIYHFKIINDKKLILVRVDMAG
ncbi:hypothetical protein EZJ43_13320 [Pedobacter changchengzhani]|uniref:Lipoprotein n=1 Tax=Pedobacter changchengzhani TaxID=2529274 RepID=A0A4R5MK72_9SPHI|nr:hypothetical protein [Pedobacter changchengzhani]TDG35595.1 hypothetical protein EZJ43_13320 [Pedobacter changchengzhani]